MTTQSRKTSKAIKITLIVSTVVVVVVAGNLMYFGTDWFKPSTNGNGDNTTYSWATDTNRFTFPENVSNVTLEIFYGDLNGTTEVFENISMTNHYTTIFDVLNSCCVIEYEIFWWNNPSFFITGINYLLENDSQQKWWLYEVDGVAIPAAANAYAPENNSLIYWHFTK